MTPAPTGNNRRAQTRNFMDLSALPDNTITIGERSAVPGLLVILHGSLLMPKIAALLASGKLDANKLPQCLVITAPSNQDCYSPWPVASVRTEAPNFGGLGKEFLSDIVLPAVEKYAAHNLSHLCGTLSTWIGSVDNAIEVVAIALNKTIGDMKEKELASNITALWYMDKLHFRQKPMSVE